MADHGAGLSLAVLSALFNGSFVSFSKFEAAKIVHPFVFNLYLAVGVFISSCTVIPFMSLLGSPPLICILGVLAGLLLAAATSLSFIAVSSIGVSSGQGIFGAAAILVSFLWGTLGPAPIGVPVVSMPLSLLATALLLLGVAGIVNCEAIGRCVSGQLDDVPQPAAPPLMEPLASQAHRSEELEELVCGSSRHGGPGSSGGGGGRTDGSHRVVGVVAAVFVGVFGGSILVPLGFLDAEYRGVKALAFLPSFGFGALLGSASLCGLWHMVASRPRPSRSVAHGSTTLGTEDEPIGPSARGPDASYGTSDVVGTGTGVSAEPDAVDAPCNRVVSSVALGRPATFLAGVASGLVWNLGNVCQLLAQSVFSLPYGVAYPILQASLVVAGILGITCFGELRQKEAIVAFFAASALVVAGAVLLGLYGPSPSKAG